MLQGRQHGHPYCLLGCSCRPRVGDPGQLWAWPLLKAVSPYMRSHKYMVAFHV